MGIVAVLSSCNFYFFRIQRFMDTFSIAPYLESFFPVIFFSGFIIDNAQFFFLAFYFFQSVAGPFIRNRRPYTDFSVFHYTAFQIALYQLYYTFIFYILSEKIDENSAMFSALTIKVEKPVCSAQSRNRFIICTKKSSSLLVSFIKLYVYICKAVASAFIADFIALFQKTDIQSFEINLRKCAVNSTGICF